jgi:hypothetical protein
MNSSDADKGRGTPKDKWFAATSLSDPNAALWASIMPPREPSLGTSLSALFGAFWQRVSGDNPALALPALLERAGSSRWVLAGVLGVCVGGALSIYGSVASSSGAASRGREGAAQPSPQALQATRSASNAATGGSAPRTTGADGLALGLPATPQTQPRAIGSKAALAGPAADAQTPAWSLPPSAPRLSPRGKVKAKQVSAGKKASAGKRKPKSMARRLLLEARRGNTSR